MFGTKNKEDLKKQASDLQEQLQEIEQQEKRIEDARKKEESDKAYKLKKETERINRYHLSEPVEVRIFSFILFLINNPTMTFVDGQGLIHRYNLVDELGKDKWNLLEYFQQITKLVNDDDIL